MARSANDIIIPNFARYFGKAGEPTLELQLQMVLQSLTLLPAARMNCGSETCQFLVTLQVCGCFAGAHSIGKTNIEFK